MITIANATPHVINILPTDWAVYDKTKRKHIMKPEFCADLEDPSTFVASFQPSGMLLNIEFEERLHEVDGLPMCTRLITNISEIPDEYRFIITSAFFANEAKKVHASGYERLLTVGSPVYKDDTCAVPVGCLHLLTNV